MDTVQDKFKNTVRLLKYNQIQVKKLNIHKVIEWSCLNLNPEVKQLSILGWDMQDKHTWEELIFSNCILNWYGDNISFYITSSYVDFNLAYNITNSTVFSKLRHDFKLLNQVSVLVDPYIMIDYEDLDTIYDSLDITSGCTKLNLSHYGDKEDIKPGFTKDWGWLDYTDDLPIKWNKEQLKVLK